MRIEKGLTHMKIEIEEKDIITIQFELLRRIKEDLYCLSKNNYYTKPKEFHDGIIEVNNVIIDRYWNKLNKMYKEIEKNENN